MLTWYDHPGHKAEYGGLYHASLDEKVAEAVRPSHPDRAIEIWQRLAEGWIAQVKPKAYEASAPYLRKVRDTLVESGREGEWDQYLKKLRQQNSRRPRCLEVLARVAEGRRRIVDG